MGQAELISLYCSPDCLSTTVPTFGMMFRDYEDFKHKIENFAISRNFNFTHIKNDKARVTVHCAEQAAIGTLEHQGMYL